MGSFGSFLYINNFPRRKSFFGCPPSVQQRNTRSKRRHNEALSPTPTRTNRGKESRCTPEEGQRARTADHAPQRDKQCRREPAGRACLGLQGTRRTSRSTCRGWLRRRTVLDRTRAWGRKGTHTGVLPLRQDRGRAPGPPGKVGTRPGCRASSGRWPRPLAQERRAAGAQLTRARSGDRQARVVLALAPD